MAPVNSRVKQRTENGLFQNYVMVKLFQRTLPWETISEREYNVTQLCVHDLQSLYAVPNSNSTPVEGHYINCTFWQRSVATPSEPFDWQIRYLDIYLFGATNHGLLGTVH